MSVLFLLFLTIFICILKLIIFIFLVKLAYALDVQEFLLEMTKWDLIWWCVLHIKMATILTDYLAMLYLPIIPSEAAFKVSEVGLEIDEDMAGKQLARATSFMVDYMSAFFNDLFLMRIALSWRSSCYLQILVLRIPEMRLNKVWVCPHRDWYYFFHFKVLIDYLLCKISSKLIDNSDDYKIL